MLRAIFFGHSAVTANLLDERAGPSDRGKRQNPITGQNEQENNEKASSEGHL